MLIKIKMKLIKLTDYLNWKAKIKKTINEIENLLLKLELTPLYFYKNSIIQGWGLRKTEKTLRKIKQDLEKKLQN